MSVRVNNGPAAGTNGLAEATGVLRQESPQAEPPPEGPPAPARGAAWPGEAGCLYRQTEVRILVMDDDAAVCRVIQAALAPNDFKVDVLSDPAQVEAALQLQPYHLII